MPNTTNTYDSASYGSKDAPPFSPVHSYSEVSTVNPNKEFQLAIYSSISAARAATNFSNWRVYLTSGKVTPESVNSLVKLYPEEYSNFELSYENTYDKPIQEVMGKLNGGGTLGKIKGLLEGITAGNVITGDAAKSEYDSAHTKYISKYLNIPAWQKTSQLQMPKTLTFSFHFGMAGIYDAYREVVKPIVTLAKIFAPSQSAKSGLLDGPMPTSAYVLGKMISGMASEGLQKGDTTSEAFDMVAQANAIMGNLVTSFNDNIEKLPLGRICVAKYGNLRIPPFIVGGASMSFDLTEVDENGYPYKGKLVVSNCESVTMAHAELIDGLIKVAKQEPEE